MVEVILLSKSGRKIIIYDPDYHDLNLEDDENIIFLNMREVEEKIREDEKALYEDLWYFLSYEEVLCLCVDYGDMIDVYNLAEWSAEDLVTDLVEAVEEGCEIFVEKIPYDEYKELDIL